MLSSSTSSSSTASTSSMPLLSRCSYSSTSTSSSFSLSLGREFTKKHRGVRLNEALNTYHAITKITVRQQRDVWYTRKEYEQMKLESKLLIIKHRMQQQVVGQDNGGDGDGDDDDVLRGLEIRLSSELMYQRIQRRQLSKQAVYVVQEQEKKRYNPSILPSMICEAYRRYTYESQQQAYAQGIQDAIDVVEDDMATTAGETTLNAIDNTTISCPPPLNLGRGTSRRIIRSSSAKISSSIRHTRWNSSSVPDFRIFHDMNVKRFDHDDDDKYIHSSTKIHNMKDTSASCCFSSRDSLLQLKPRRIQSPAKSRGSSY